MVDFSFSFTNLREIFDEENNRGSLRKNDFPQDYWEKVEKLKEIKSKLKGRHSLKDNETLEIKDKKREINEEITDILDNYIKDIGEKINNRNFHLSITKSTNEKFEDNKPVYETANIESRLASKHIQKSLNRIYKVKPANRNQILSQLKLLLYDKSPKFLIRTDLKGFYESIPQEKLLYKLENTGLITSKALKLIRRLLVEYNNSEGISDYLGVPRGISFSAYLVEIYLEDIDEQIKNLPGVIYYARYVDDIILITLNSKSIESYFEKLELIFNSVDLEINQDKTLKLDFSGLDYIHKFNYLGYEINVSSKISEQNIVKFYLSDKKINKYKDRIKIVLQAYTNNSRFKNTNAKNKLYKCLYFLTHNSYLTGAKNEVRVGIYWSNNQLSDLTQLVKLDKFVLECLDNESIFKPYNKLYKFDNGEKDLYDIKVLEMKTEILDRFSFSKGFDEKRFHRLTANDYKEIKRVFNYET